MSEQGVAQRVLLDIQHSVDDCSGDGLAWCEELSRYRGAETMHRVLSAEARRVLAEWQVPTVPEDQIYEQGLRDMAQRLGLDLNEPEDSDE